MGIVPVVVHLLEIVGFLGLFGFPLWRRLWRWSNRAVYVARHTRRGAGL